jgi:hypothetical protein
MKTKFIKVPTTERLPEEEKWYHVFTDVSIDICPYVNGGFHSTDTLSGLEVTHFLEEIPDREDEMREMLEELLRFKNEMKRVMSENLQYPDNFLKALANCEQLLNK